MRIVLFAAMLLIVVSVPTAYAATLQLVTENGNVFSIDFDEILFLWEMQNPSNQTQAIATIHQEISDLRAQLNSITNTTDVGDIQDRIDELQEQLNSNSTSTDAAIMLLESEIGTLREQLAMVLTNSTATDTEIEMLQETIATLTTDLENLEQDGVAAGALGTSGRMVPVSASGYFVYGDDRGRPGNITEATSFNYYTGSINYVGFIPDTSTPTRYSLDSPYGSYHATQSGLVPATGSSINLNVVASRALEGDAPTVRDVGRTVEIDVGVGDKVLVQLDEADLSDVVAFDVDVEGVVAQVVTSPNDLIGTEYRDFNGTGKFVFFEGEAQHGSLTQVPYGYAHGCRDPCTNVGPPYSVYYSRYGSTIYYQMHRDQQRATAPLTLDAHVSNVAGSLSESDAAFSATYGYAPDLTTTRTSTWVASGAYDATPTFVDGLWHVTSLLAESEYSVQTRNGHANGFVAAQGTYRVTDATPYVVHADTGLLGSKTFNVVPNSSVYVLLENGGDQTYTVSNMDASLSTTTPQAYPASPSVTSGNAPRLASIERFSPSNATTNNPALTYKVTFNEDVTGVDAADFALSPDSTGETLSSTTFMSTITNMSAPSLYIPQGIRADTMSFSNRGLVTSVSVSVDITHTYIGDLKVDLIAPDGTVRTLHDRAGGTTNYIDQTYMPDFTGVPIEGTWTLRIDDNFADDSGRLNSWTLTINGDFYHAVDPVASIYGSGNTYYATVSASIDGTYNLDLIPSGHGIVDTTGTPLTDTSVSGTAKISAKMAFTSTDITISGLPQGVPWVFETVDGEVVHAGLTTSSGSITMPPVNRSADDIGYAFSLLVYEDGFGGNVHFDDMVLDIFNEEIIRQDFGHPDYNIIYIPEMYMMYPMTVSVGIDDVLLGKLSSECSVTDRIRLPYLDKEYGVGSTMHVPFVPEMSALKFSIDGTPVCIKFADVVPPVQIIPFRGDTAHSGKTRRK